MTNIIKTSWLIIYNDKGQILMQNRESISKKWEQRGFFGWHLDEWETFEQWLEREIKEELGIDLQDYELFCKVLRPDSHIKWTFRESNVYMRKTDMEETQFTVLEWDYCKFFDVQDILNLNTFPLPKHVARMFDEYINNPNYK